MTNSTAANRFTTATEKPNLGNGLDVIVDVSRLIGDAIVVSTSEHLVKPIVVADQLDAMLAPELSHRD